MRKPVAAIPTVRFAEDGTPCNLPMVICDDGAVFQMLPEADEEGRFWELLPAVPGTPRDPATKGYKE